MKRITLIIIILAIVPSWYNCLFAQSWTTFDNEDSLWHSFGGNSGVQTFFLDNNLLYVGAEAFDYGGNVHLNGIGKWNGSNWTALDGGICIAPLLNAIIKYNNYIYAGGGFSQCQSIPSTRCIARFDGTSWSSLGYALDLAVPCWVMCMAVYDNKLIVGGDMTLNNGANYGGVAAFDGTNWSTMYANSLSNVLSLAVYNGQLYTGGGFYNLKKFTGTGWTNMSGIINDYIWTQKVDTFNNFLYVSNVWYIIDGSDTIPTDNMAIWNGFYWEKVGTGGNYNGRLLGLYHGDVYYINGIDSMYTINGTDTIDRFCTGYLARWDGQNWYAAADTLGWYGVALHEYKDTLYVGGGMNYEHPEDSTRGVLGKWYMPLNTTDCHYLQPRVFSNDSVYYLNGGQTLVQFYNNNAYVDSWQWDFGDSGTGNSKDPLHTFTDTGYFNVSVTVTDGICIKTATKIIHVLLGTGMEEFTRENLKFKLYPNPTTGDITVEIKLPAGKEGFIRAYNVYGSVQGEYKIEPGENKVDINANYWPAGVSLCGVYIDNKQVILEKVIKQ